MPLKRTLALCVLAAICHAAGADNHKEPSMNDMNHQEIRNDGRHDFDFLMGRWHVRNRKLSRPLHEGATWEEFDAVNDARHVLDGMGNMDEFRAEQWRPGFIGTSLRLFNPATRQWSIYWVDNRAVVLDKPVVGGFVDSIGVFESDDVLDGRPIKVRFTWNTTDRTHPRWEQAFSADGGETWETNWIMQFSRTAGQGIAP